MVMMFKMKIMMIMMKIMISVQVSNRQLEKAGLDIEDWMYIVNKGGVEVIVSPSFSGIHNTMKLKEKSQEKEMIKCLSWFNSKFQVSHWKTLKSLLFEREIETVQFFKCDSFSII